MVLDIGFVLLLVVAVFISVRMKKLTRGGGVAGGVVATAVYLGAGYPGIVFPGVFFVLGTLATSAGKGEKKRLNSGEDAGGRTASQVMANGGVAAVCGLLAYALPGEGEWLILMLAASLSSATADTLSSELGTLYGRRFYNVLSFRRDIRGENGVVSLEGTMLGVAGSVIIALIHAMAYGYGQAFLIIIIAGTVGNIADSVLGATLERKGYIKNDAVNLLNTIVGALVALACFFQLA